MNLEVEAIRTPEEVGELPPDLEAMPLPGDPPRSAIIRVPRCPYCGGRRVRQRGTYGRVRYYQCQECVMPGGDGELTRFKGVVE